MTALSLTYPTFTNGTLADGSQVTQDFTDVTNYVNTSTIRTDGATAMAAPLNLVGTDPTAAAHAVQKSYHDGAYAVLQGALSQNFTAATWTAVKFSTKLYDYVNGAGDTSSSNLSLTTSLFTAPKKGVYLCSFATQSSNTSATYQQGMLTTSTQSALGVVPGLGVQGNVPATVQSGSPYTTLPLYLAAGGTVQPAVYFAASQTGMPIGWTFIVCWLHA
jgi:hypothetical protein